MQEVLEVQLEMTQVLEQVPQEEGEGDGTLETEVLEVQEPLHKMGQYLGLQVEVLVEIQGQMVGLVVLVVLAQVQGAVVTEERVIRQEVQVGQEEAHSAPHLLEVAVQVEHHHTELGVQVQLGVLLLELRLVVVEVAEVLAG